MKKPSVLQFAIQQESDGGFVARAVGYSIYTEGDTFEQISHNIREAVDCFFDEDEKASDVLPILANFEIPQAEDIAVQKILASVHEPDIKGNPRELLAQF